MNQKTYKQKRQCAKLSSVTTSQKKCRKNFRSKKISQNGKCINLPKQINLQRKKQIAFKATSDQ